MLFHGKYLFIKAHSNQKFNITLIITINTYRAKSIPRVTNFIHWHCHIYTISKRNIDIHSCIYAPN